MTMHEVTFEDSITVAALVTSPVHEVANCSRLQLHEINYERQ